MLCYLAGGLVLSVFVNCLMKGKLFHKGSPFFFFKVGPKYSMLHILCVFWGEREMDYEGT